MCKLKILSLIVKKESLISLQASLHQPAMTHFFSRLKGVGQLERWALNLTPARLKWQVKRVGRMGRARFAIPPYFYSF